jgi:hypothetical protein
MLAIAAASAAFAACVLSQVVNLHHCCPLRASLNQSCNNTATAGMPVQFCLAALMLLLLLFLQAACQAWLALELLSAAGTQLLIIFASK